MKYYAAFLTLLIGLVGVYAAFKPGVIEQIAGSTSPDNYTLTRFLADETIGGNIIASSTSASVTLTGNEFKNANTLDYTVNVGSITLTLPASTTAMCSSLGKNERRVVLIRNATTTASSNITLAGGTGFLLKSASSTKVIPGNTDGANFGIVTIIRKANSDCDALFNQYI